GIRVFHVTGVQTCALPISDRRSRNQGFRRVIRQQNKSQAYFSLYHGIGMANAEPGGAELMKDGRRRRAGAALAVLALLAAGCGKIGRASWRGSVKDCGCGV